MSKKYDFKQIEKKWQGRWLKEKTYEPSFAKGSPFTLRRAQGKNARKHFYNLMMFPYPSAEGLHVGNMYAFTGADIYGRFKRMQGYDVFEPIGLDGFGIHSENYALKIGTHPAKQSKISEKRFYKQLASIGNGFAWNEHLETYDPEYYKWTQWIFAEMFKKGLAYRKKQAVNWCPSCKTVLADEQVINGKCERCGTEVVKKDLEQWFFRITKYADRLLSELKGLDWSERVKIAQENWIGKSEGAEINFSIKNSESKIKRFVLLHGRRGSPDRNFFPWLKIQLEKQGYEVLVPTLPNTESPDDKEQADYVIENCKLDEQTAILGHSFGGVIALRILERGIRLGRVILVATPSSGNFLNNRDIPMVAAAVKKGFNFELIKNNCRSFVVLNDEEDDVVPVSDGEFLALKIGVRFIKETGKESHFCAKEEPALLDVLSQTIKVFTTRLDTLFGATYLVLSPEYPLLKNNEFGITNYDEVRKYIDQAKKKPETDRIAEGKDPSTDSTSSRQAGSGQVKTGVELKGVKAVNPANGEEIPIWVADYVLGSYGTGAIMAVPAHDERDFEFAKKFHLPIKQVIANETGSKLENEVWVDGGSGVVFDPATQKYAAAKWDNGLLGLFSGGLSEGEGRLEGVSREIEEESGLYDFKRTERIYDTYAHYYNHAKNVNRTTHATCYLFILKTAKTKPYKREDHEKFEVVWVSADEFLANLEEWNQKRGGDLDHWVGFLKRSVTRAIELGFDKVSNPTRYKLSSYGGVGILVNSGKFDGMDSERAKWEITKFVGGKRKIQYRFRDWLISRQRYWGPPIPMIYCGNCAKAGRGEQRETPGWYAVPEKDLPVKLPIVKDFRPRGTGESPLATVKTFYEVKCPKCKEKARRETDVSDTFLDSAWYYLRYLNPKNKKSAIDKVLAKKWLPIDLYTGGAEHSVLHLLYVRFLAKVFHDWGLVSFDEPAKRFRAHGLLIKDGAKMSKSKGNVINPDEYIEKFGADTLRMYLMFLAPFEQGGDFRDSGILGVERFLARVWKLYARGIDTNIRMNTNDTNKDFERLLNKTIKKVTEDIETLNYNTAVSAMMILLNEMERQPKLSAKSYESFIKLLAPFAPYMVEEIWREVLGNKESIHISEWPKYDPKKIKDEKFTLVIQINGRVRDSVEVEAGISQAEVEKLVLVREKIREHLSGAKPKKIIFVPGRLVNLVI